MNQMMRPNDEREGSEGKPVLLLVDDDADLVEVFALFLGEAGYEVIVASSLAEARQKIAAHPKIDLLLSDFSLPDGTGFEVRSCFTKPLRAAVLMSGHAVNVGDSGFTDYVIKPASFDDVLAALQGGECRT